MFRTSYIGFYVTKKEKKELNEAIEIISEHECKKVFVSGILRDAIKRTIKKATKIKDNKK